MKTLPQKLGAGPAEMNPLLLSALLHHRCDPTMLLYLLGAAIAIALGAKRRQQARRQRAPRSGQRLKNEKIRMCARCLLDLAVQIRDPPRATCAAVVRSLAPSPVSPPARLHPEWPAWPGLWHPAALGAFLMPASTLTEELPQLCGRYLLQLLQRKPTLQQVTHQLRVQR